jgi:Uma2 family endonuclease
MQARQQHYVSPDDYLRSEESSPVRHEYVGGALHAMAGASERHNQIVSNLHLQLRLAARGSGCRVFTSDMLVQAAADLFYYPDVVVLCDPTDNHPRVKQRPCMVFEVLSPTTAPIDGREKLRAYREMPSVQAVFLVQQDMQCVECHLRGDDHIWRHFTQLGDGSFAVPCVAAELAMADVYEDAFTAAPDATL